MRVLCGTDVIEIARMAEVLERTPRLVDRIFDPRESEYAYAHVDPTPYLATRFCAKEAVMKVLGKGIGTISFRDIVVVRVLLERPKIELTNAAATIARKVGLVDLDVSLSHSKTIATAMAVGVIQD